MLKTKNFYFVLVVTAFVALFNLSLVAAQATNTGLTPKTSQNIILELLPMIVVNVILGLVGLWMAKRRNLNPVVGFLLGLLFSLLGILIILILPKHQKPETKVDLKP